MGATTVSSPAYFLPLMIISVVFALMMPRLDAANILLSGSLGEGSHFMAQVPIGKSLLQQGHNVTFMVSQEFSHRAEDPELSELFNFEIVSFNDPEVRVKDILKKVAEIGFTQTGGMQQMLNSFGLSRRFQVDTCHNVLNNKPLMKRFERIDAMLVDLAWPCGVFIKAYLTRHSNVSDFPLILTSPAAPIGLYISLAGSPVNPAYFPNMMTGFSNPMTFLERTINAISCVFLDVFYNMIMNMYADLVEEHDLPRNLRTPLKSFHEYIDLYLTNADFAVESPLPLMPNVIAVGGLTSGPAKPLSRELEDYMQSSGDHGVVVFSLGTYFSSFFASRPEILKMFLDAFSRIPQKVIMQLKETSHSFELPPNVKVLPWLPQNDLLGHAKTRAFMYQGGNNGFQEAVYHGVPIVVLPFFGDQIDIAARVVDRGLGLMLDKERLSADVIHHHLTEVIENPKYCETCKRVSAIFRDRPMRPADRAAFWINHVITHRGDYMRSPCLDLSFIQRNLIDVIVFLLFILGVGFFSLYLAFKCLLSCVRTCLMGSRGEKMNKKKD